MSMKYTAQTRKILFLSDNNRYLEHNLYCQLSLEIGNRADTIYFQCDYSSDIAYPKSESKDYSEKWASFGGIEVLSPISLDMSKLKGYFSKLKRIIRNYRSIYQWKDEFLRTIDRLKPDLVVLISCNGINARLLARFRPEIRRAYIQPATLRRRYSDQYSVLETIQNFIFNVILKLPIRSVKETFFDHYGGMDLFLWSKLWMEHYKPREDSKYFYLGAPQYDFAFKAFSARRREHKDRAVIGIVLNKESFIGVDEWKVFSEIYTKLISSNPQFDFVIKPHPRTEPELIREFFSDNVVTDDQLDLTEIDVVISYWSTLIFEYMASGVPCILLNPDGRYDLSYRFLGHYSAVAHDEIGLLELIQKYKDPFSEEFQHIRKQFISKTLTFDDGVSTKRVSRALLDLAKSENLN